MRKMKQLEEEAQVSLKTTLNILLNMYVMNFRNNDKMDESVLD